MKHWSTCLFVALVISMTTSEKPKKPAVRRKYKEVPLPSLSEDHYSEVFTDGSYKFAYTGEKRYHVEKRSVDGVVEGETVYVRPDGVPIRVHYFADSKGYRPRTEVLVDEVDVRPHAPSNRRLVPHVVYKEVDVGRHDVVVNRAHHVVAGLSRAEVGGSVVAEAGHAGTAVASPSITAIVGPGGIAIASPNIVAKSGSASVYDGAHHGPVSSEAFAKILDLLKNSRTSSSDSTHHVSE